MLQKIRFFDKKDPKLSLSELLSGWQYSNLFIWPSMGTRFMKVSTEIDNIFGYEKITQLVDNIPLSWLLHKNIKGKMRIYVTSLIILDYKYYIYQGSVIPWFWRHFCYKPYIPWILLMNLFKPTHPSGSLV
jgi:hypothetical protein